MLLAQSGRSPGLIFVENCVQGLRSRTGSNPTDINRFRRHIGKHYLILINQLSKDFAKYQIYVNASEIWGWVFKKII